MMPISERHALVLTDDDELARGLNDTLAACGLDALTTPGIDDALDHLEAGSPALVLVDLDFENGSAADFIAQARQSWDMNRILLLISDNSMERAFSSLANGAAWFLKKPVSISDITIVIEQLRLKRDPILEDDTSIYGSSPEIQSVLKVVARAASGDAHVTITGEPGTGKRLVGRRIHESSNRSRAPFMQFSCNGMSASFVDGELFGSDESAGAGGEPQPGCLASCQGGTLLIDEIESLPTGIQTKLFAYLSQAQGHSLSRTAETDDVRIIAASSRRLDEWVREGRLHGGLVGLLGGLSIAIPPLRDRRSDIPILVDHFSRRAARQLGKTLKGTAPDALACLIEYEWTGNVRELEDLIDHAVHSSTGTLLRVEDLPSLPESAGPNQTTFRPGATIQEIEREVILRTLESTGGSTGRAAKVLNMSVRKIQYKLKEYREEAAVAARVERAQAAMNPQPIPTRRSDFVARAQKKH